MSEYGASWSEANTTFVDKNDFLDMIGMAQGIVGMVLNTLAWLVIVRTKSLHSMTNYLLAYLAVIDSIYCFSIFFDSSIKLWITVHGTFIGREIFCRIINSSFVLAFSTYSSIYGLCLVTYERYIGIVHPLHYPRLMSAKKVSFIIFLLWMLAILFSSPFLFTSTAGKETDIACEYNIDFTYTLDLMREILHASFCYFLPVIFMGWAYYKIQATLKRSARQLQQQNVQGAALELLQARQNVIHMLRIVMGVLFVLFTPSMMQGIFCLLPQNEKVCSSERSEIVAVLFYNIYNMNSVINPIIYVFKYKKFQKGLQDMLCCCIGRHLTPKRVGIQMNEHTP